MEKTAKIILSTAAASTFFGRIHIDSQYRRLVFVDIQRKEVPIEIEGFLYSVVGADVAKTVVYPLYYHPKREFPVTTIF